MKRYINCNSVTSYGIFKLHYSSLDPSDEFNVIGLYLDYDIVDTSISSEAEGIQKLKKYKSEQHKKPSGHSGYDQTVTGLFTIEDGEPYDMIAYVRYDGTIGY